MHISRLNKLYIASFALLVSFFLQSCNLATNNLPSRIKDFNNDQARHSSKTSFEQDGIINASSLDLDTHVFTTSCGEKISFLEEAGVWKAQMPASYLGVGMPKTLPVICEHQGDILTMLNRLAKQRPTLHKHRIHLLPTPSQSQCVFLGSCGLLGGMKAAAASADATLHEAVKTEELVLVESLLASGADPNSPDHNGVTPLENATWQGCFALVNLLLENGADPNQLTSLNFSYLHFAAMKNYVAIAKLLIAKGVNVNAGAKLNNISYTPLDLAMRLGHVTLVQLLLENGANPTLTKEGLQIFNWAAEKGHLDILNLLLENYAEFINLRCQNGFTLLSLAAQQGHVAVARLLLDKGADPNMAAENGFTPLHWAAEKGKLELVNLLVEKGATLHAAANQDGFTPLHLAVDQNHIAVARLLLDKGADPNMAAEIGTTPLHWAAYNGHVEQSNLLIEKGADLNITDYKGWTPLHIAASQGYLGVILSLLSHKPDLNIQSNHGESFLHILADDTNIHILLKALRCIEGTQHVALNHLLGVMEDCCPELTNNDTKRILAIIVDYVAGLDVSLKDQEDFTALAILQQLELELAEEADYQAAQEALTTLQRHQILGGWLTLPKLKRKVTTINNDSSMHESALKKTRYQ